MTPSTPEAQAPFPDEVEGVRAERDQRCRGEQPGSGDRD